MKQVLHVFAKDVRRFWPEISISLAITTAFVLMQPLQWKASENIYNAAHTLVPGFLSLLVPVSWWVLIARVIHEERLVGDTQFWITRPYEWKRLLCSKAFFLLAFLMLPLFLAQSLILGEAGFQPLSFFHGLLYSLFLCGAILVLPLAAFAAVTSTFARMTLTMLGVLLAAIALESVLSLMFSTSSGSMSFPLRDSIYFWIYLMVGTIAITLAYALRKPWISRLLLIALPVLICAISLVASHFDRAQVERRYPAGQGAHLVQLAYSPVAKDEQTSTWGTFRHTQVPISIPLAVSGVAQNRVILPEGIRAEVTGPDGYKWESEWQPETGIRFTPNEVDNLNKPAVERFNIPFMMPIEVFNKFQSKPVNVRLTFAVSEAKVVRESVVALPQGGFAVPDFGICAAQSGWLLNWEFMGVSCLSPLRQPPLTYISAHWSSQPCSAGNSAESDGPIGDTWVGSLEREAADFSISPVADPHINLSNNTVGYPSKQRFLCPGTPVRFREYGLERRTQISVDAPGFQLPEMTVQGNRITLTTHIAHIAGQPAQ
jgi:hypothetical protein